MKICIFTHTTPRFPGDTAAPFIGTLAEAMAKKHDVFVLAPFDKKIKRTSHQPYRLVTYKYIFPDSLHRLGYSRTLEGDKTLSAINFILSPFLYLFGFLALLRLVKKERIDIISAHWIIPNGFLAAWVKIVAGVPFTVTIPGSDVYMGRKNFFFKWMVGFAANYADYVLSDSSYYLRQLDNLGFKPRKRMIIRYGVNAQKFRPMTKNETILRKLGLGKGDLIVLAVGRLVAKKGFQYLIDAMPVVMKKIPRAKLVIIGDGEEKEMLEEKVSKYGIGNLVIFAGMISYNELSKYYNLADVFVMPSVKDEKGNLDASPVTMMEAMCCGLPVVATRFAGGKDIVVKGRTGFLVEAGNSQQIANSVIKILKAKNMSTKVRKIAVANFSSFSLAGKYLKIFKRVIDEKE